MTARTDSIPTPVERTAFDIIWDQALIFARAAATNQPAPCLATGALWAVHGSECRPRELREGEDTLVAEVCDVLEQHFGCTLPEYEADNAAGDLGDIAFDLAMIAFEVERELQEAING